MFKFIIGMAVGAIVTGALTYTGGTLDYKGDTASALDNAKAFYTDVKTSLKEEE